MESGHSDVQDGGAPDNFAPSRAGSGVALPLPREPDGGTGGANGSFSILRRRGPWKDALRRRMLAAGDFLAVLTAAAVIWRLEGPLAALVTVGLLPVWGLLAKLHGLYDRDHAKIRHVTLDEVSSLFYWATLSVVASSLALSVLPGVALDGLSAVAMWSAAFLTSFTLRAAARPLWRHVVPPDRTLVLGEGPLAEHVTRKLTLERGHHVELVGLSEASGTDGVADEHMPRSTLELAIRTLEVSRVILARQDLDEAALSSVVRVCRATEVRLSVAPPLQAMLGTAVNLNHLAELPVVEFRTWDPSRSTMLLKRTVDLAGAAAGVALTAPLMALIAVAVRLDSRGPVLFAQVRAGRDGRPFRLLKFRTMVRDAEAQLEEMIPIASLPEPMFKLRDDPRVTRIGRILRRTSLDELPQLWNVLRGEMSLVGPRPEEMRFVTRYGEAERVRLAVRPGITGPMQVHGRAELTFAERLAVEREYIENYSFRKDLKILVQSVGAVYRGQGAF